MHRLILFVLLSACVVGEAEDLENETNSSALKEAVEVIEDTGLQ